MSKKIVPVCGKCGATGVRIYRDYGMFRRPENDRCNDCFDGESGNEWFVPCILDESDGSCWGYSSVPWEECDKFYALPEKSATKPYWVEEGSHWSNSKVY